MLIIEEIKREMEKDLLGINLDRHEGKIALHYYKDSFRTDSRITHLFIEPHTIQNINGKLQQT